MSDTSNELLFSKLNLETAVIPWHELQRFFAQGKVFVVNKENDLVKIARDVAADQRDKVLQSVKNSSIQPVSDRQAKQWIKDNAQVWAVVVAPWILVQELGEDD